MAFWGRAIQAAVLGTALPALFLVSQPYAVNAAHAAVAPKVPTRFLKLAADPPANQTDAPPPAPAPPDDKPIPLPDGKGKDVTARICSGCHQTDVFAMQRHTRTEWRALVDLMISRGAQGTDREFAQITDYLTASFPKPEAKPSAEPDTSGSAPPPQHSPQEDKPK